MNCDVLIIGGGVSGLVAAKKLTNCGFKTILIEKSRNYGAGTSDKIDVTESTDILQIIEELNLPIIGKSGKSRWLTTGNAFNFQSKVEDVYIKRGTKSDSFENRCFNSANRNGLMVFLNSTVLRFNHENNFVNSVIVSIAGTQKIFKPKFIICADGSNSFSRREFGLAPSSKIIKLRAFGVSSKKINLQSNMALVFFDAKLLPGCGYFYAIKTQKFATASIVMDEAFLAGRTLKSYWDNLLQSNNEIKSIVSQKNIPKYISGGCDVAKMNTFAFGNVFFSGDAGYFMDPLFGYGVRQAIYSGYMAANAISENFNNPKNAIDLYIFNMKKIINENNSAWRYREFVSNLTNSDLAYLIKFAKEFESSNEIERFINNPLCNLEKLIKLIYRFPKIFFLLL